MGNKQEKNKKPKLDDKNITSGKIKDFNTNDSRNNSKRDILKNIKSKYIMIFIFSHLEEKRKLEIIKYNKNIQNILDIKLINYKFYQGKSLIYELNGNAKEYNEYAKIAKDCGSAATGLMSVLATVVNLIIFTPYIIKFFMDIF